MADQKASACFHCHLPVPVNFNQSLTYHGKERYFCCMGCFSIAETIISNGLDDYYKFRTSTAPKAEDLVPEELAIFDEQEVLDSFVATSDSDYQSIELLCDNLQCSACSWLIEKHIGKLAAVRKVITNVSEQSIYLEWNSQTSKLSEILIRFHQLGYPAKPYQADQAQELQQHNNKTWLKRLGLAGLGMMQVMMYAVALYIGAFDDIDTSHRNFLRWVSFLVATPVLFYSGYPFFQSASRALKSFKLNMDVPIALALTLAYLSSIWATLTQGGEVYFDSVTMFVFFLLIGRYLEYRARQKVRQQFNQKEFNNLLVQKIDPDNSNQLLTLPIQKINIGDQLLIKPGATIAFDGVIKKGSTSINEAMLSGEFMPINKQTHDRVLAGSVNGDTAIEIEVTHLNDQSFIHRLKQLQRMALLEKPQLTMIADKVARYFVAVILIIATVTFSYWWSKEPEHALWITISVLVVSCPCALSLATPVALTCGISALNQRNFLVQDQNFLQKLEKTSDVVFDKTGTLTEGQLTLEKLDIFSALNKEQILTMIAAMESQSEHPIAKAFTSFASKSVTANQIKIYPFAGVSAEIDGANYYFGNAQFIQAKLEHLKIAIETNALYLADDNQLLAKVLLTDTIREKAQQLTQRLQQSGKELHLLSGDPSEQVEKLAKTLNIKHWKNGLQPEDKLKYIQELKSFDPDRHVLTVGDGVNDAPIMAFSDTTIAMAGASDLTKSHADSYLLSAKLEDIEYAINKSAQTNAIIKQNLTWSIGYNLIMIPFAIAGMIPPYLAAIGMSLSSIVVVINSLRLKDK